MQEAIIEIGKSVLKEEGILSSLIQDVEPKDKKGNMKYLVKFNFNTKEKNLEIDLIEEMSEESSKKYLYIGSAAGANSPQWYVTSTTFAYPISETIANLCSHDFGDELNEELKEILKEFYVDIGEEFKSTKNRYILDFKKFGIGETDVRDIYTSVIKGVNETDEKKRMKAIKDGLKKNYQKIFTEYLKSHDLKTTNIGLYIILINGKPLCQFEEYKEAVIKEKEGSNGKKKSKKNSSDSNCSICGEKENLTADMSKTKLKFYTTNQAIFGSGIKKDYEKSMLMCSECLSEILAGESYIINNLNTDLAGFTVFIIPHFLLGEGVSKQDLDRVSAGIKKKFNTVKNYKDIESFRDSIDEFIENEQENSYYLVNFVFYKQNQKATKIQKMIKDINPSIFEKMAVAMTEVGDMGKKLFGEGYEANISLGRIYRTVPIRINNKREATQYKNLMQLYDSIFSTKFINKDFILSNILECVRIQYYEKEGFNVTKGSVYNTITMGNFFIKFLEKMNCLEEGESMDVNKINVKDELKDYILSMEYDEQQTAMFLMGYMIGKIGSSQRNKSSEGKKPILNKLNFGGMDKGKIVRLTGDIFNKMKQEKILKYNEGIFGECKRLMDANFNQWKLNKNENLFYILSGYSYVTTKLINSKKDGGKKDEQ